MKTSIQRVSFLETLKLASSGLAEREDGINQSTCFVFRDGAVFTFNEEVFVTAPLSGFPFNGAFPSSVLLSILGKLPDAELEAEVRQIESEEEDAIPSGELILKGKRKKCGLRFESEIKLPIESVELPGKSDWKEAPDNLLRAIGMVADCCSSNDLHFALRCVHITKKFVEACDNAQACRHRISIPVDADSLVRYETVKRILKHTVTHMAVTKNWLFFKDAAGCVIGLRRYLDQYPSLKEVFSVDDGSPISIPDDLAESVSNATVFTSTGEDSVLSRELIQVGLTKGKMAIHGEGTLGWYRESKPTKYNGPDITFSVSPAVLTTISKEVSEALISSNRLMMEGKKWRMAFHLHAKDEEKKEAGKKESEEGEE